jgi:chemotaxis protein MotB
MRHILTALTLTVVVLFSIGCVADGKHRDLNQAYRKSQEQVVEAQNRIAELEQQIELLQAGPRENARRVVELTNERDTLIAKLDELNAKYEELAKRPSQIITLAPEVDSALKEFAEANGDLVEYDSSRGMVKFRSDLTFDLGSASVKNDAAQTLGQLGTLLTTEVASRYEVRVVGHTDTVRIAKPETKAKHPTNWHLSVHRAIAVRDALEQGGVPAVRTSVGGSSMYRPVAQNTTTGAEQNRRVEIYLVPMTAVNDAFIEEGTAAPAPAPAPAPVSSGGSDIPLK